MKYNISLEVKTTLYAPLPRVWEALTEPAQIKKYFFGTNTITDWKPGSPIIFKGEWEGKTYADKGVVLDMEKNKLIRYSYWSSLSGIENTPENYVIVTYELENNNDTVLLTIRQENIPDEKRKAHALENWNKVVEGLKKVVEMQGTSVDFY